MEGDVSDLITARCRGYVDSVQVEFVPKKDFYYSWSIGSRSASIRISDYLEGAPDDVLADFGEMIIRRAKRLQWKEPESFIRFVTSEDYIVSRRPVFIRRSRNLLRTDVGKHAFIPDSVDRLLDAGLLQPRDIENSWFSWTRRDNMRRVGFCGTMFRVVGISSVLDSNEISDEVRDYVVYHECLHLRQGYRPSQRVHDSEFRAWERSYPDWQECERTLRSLQSLLRCRRIYIRYRHEVAWSSADSYSMERTERRSCRSIRSENWPHATIPKACMHWPWRTSSDGI